VVRGSLDGRLRRVRRLETGLRGTLPPSRTQEEAWAIDAEVRELEKEMNPQGIDPDECLRGVSMDLPLDEHIAKLEAEIAREERQS
jgi:hypothetical protein